MLPRLRRDAERHACREVAARDAFRDRLRLSGGGARPQRARTRRCRAVRRHLQPLFRAARISARPRQVLARRRLSRHGGDAGRRRIAAAVLRPHLPRRRPGRGGPPRGGAHASLRSRPYAERGMPIIGLEPSCLFTFRDEFPAMLQGPTRRERCRSAGAAVRGIPRPRAERRPAQSAAGAAAEDGRCCTATAIRKSFGAMGAVESVLQLIPELKVEDRRIELLRHGRRFRLSTPRPSTSR